MPNGIAGDPYAAYGAIHQQHLEAGSGNGAMAGVVMKQPFYPRQRTRMNIVAICVSLFVPWILFCVLYLDVSFFVHYKYSQLCWGLVGLGCVFVCILGLMAAFKVHQLVKGSSNYVPSWISFVFLTSILAVAVAAAAGSMNFWHNMQPYYDILNLNDYSSVDPTRMRGQQLMDAGRVQFLPGAMLDLRKSYAFQNLDTYCVAPITMNNVPLGAATPLANYDFWAVGLNCCGGDKDHEVIYQCGAYNQKDAREGLRLMSDDQRAFFRLAVQQAEAKHMITASHPLFFYWTGDANADLQSYKEEGYRYYAAGMMGFFLMQLLLVLVASFVLSKVGL